MTEIERLRRMAADLPPDQCGTVRRMIAKELEEHIERKILDARRKRLAAQVEKTALVVGKSHPPAAGSD